MSITLQRAVRNTDIHPSKMPVNIGPGTYDPRVGSKEDRENIVPFNTIKERQPNIANDNPGPGDYAQDRVKVVATVKDMMSNSFTTKIPRFCPTAPGSSVFGAPTYIENPGPGTHF